MLSVGSFARGESPYPLGVSKSIHSLIATISTFINTQVGGWQRTVYGVAMAQRGQVRAKSNG